MAQGFAEQLDARACASTVRALRGDVLNRMDAAVAAERLSVLTALSNQKVEENANQCGGHRYNKPVGVVGRRTLLLRR